MTDHVFLEERLAFRSSTATARVAAIWREFYSRADGAETDRAVWICSSEGYVSVRPGHADDDWDADLPFEIQMEIDGIRELVEEAIERSEQEFGRLLDELHSWIRDAIAAAWAQVGIQRLHAKNVPGRFGIYTAQFADISVQELDEMTWLAGDDLETD